MLVSFFVSPLVNEFGMWNITFAKVKWISMNTVFYDFVYNCLMRSKEASQTFSLTNFNLTKKEDMQRFDDMIRSELSLPTF